MEVYIILFQSNALQPYTGNGYPGEGQTLPSSKNILEAQEFCEQHFLQQCEVVQKRMALVWKEEVPNCKWVATIAR